MSRRRFAKQQRTRRRSNVAPLTGAVIGQSNGTRWFDNSAVSGQTNEGEQAFLDAINVYNPDVTLINGATGGSAAHIDADTGSGYWYDPDTETFGDAWDNMITALDGATPDFFVYTLGETDISALFAGTITARQHEDAVFGVLEGINALFPDAIILIQRIGRLNQTISSLDVSYNTVRTVQDLAESTLDYVYFGCETYDQPMADTYHYENYTTIGARNAERVAALKGYRSEVGTLGAHIVAVSASNGSTTVRVVIEHDAGDDVDKTGSFSNQGWRVLVNGVNRTGSANVIKIDENTFDLTITTAPSGAQAITVDYVINSLKNITNANLSNFISDNAEPVMPLRGTRGFVATKV